MMYSCLFKKHLWKVFALFFFLREKQREVWQFKSWKEQRTQRKLVRNIFFFKTPKEWKGKFNIQQARVVQLIMVIDGSQGYHSQVRAVDLGFIFSTNLLHKSLYNDFQQVQGKLWLLFFYHPTWSCTLIF